MEKWVVLEKEGAKAEIIEYYGRREIRVRVSGKLKKDLMTIVTYELDNIHASFNRLKYKKLIPCNCTDCKQTQEPHFYPFEVLTKFISDQQERIQYPISYEMVNVRSLIDDVLDSMNYIEKEFESGKITIHGNVGEIIYQETSEGINIMSNVKKKDKIRSAWANGLFYLFVFVVVIAGIGFLANSVSIWALPIVIIAGVIFVPLIGALQLRQDDRLSEKSFMQLIPIVLDQLPLISQLAKLNRTNKV